MTKQHKYLIEGLEGRLKTFFGVQTAQELADLFEENNNTFNHYLIGRNRIPYELLIKIYHSSKRRNRPPISLSWLLTGEGDMYSIPKDFDLEGHERFAIKEFLMRKVLEVSERPSGDKLKKSEME